MDKYKLIALDLDGTLLNSSGKIGDEDKEFLTELISQGKHVILISGRPSFGMLEQIKELGLDKVKSVYGSFNGGRISYTNDNQIISNEVLHAKDINKVRELSLKTKMVTVNYLSDKYFVNHDDNNFAKIESLYSNVGYIEIKNIEDDFTDNKCLVVGNEELVNENLALFKNELKHLNIATSKPFFIEVTPKDIDKGHALKKIGKLLEVDPSEMIAFGDGQNDKEMLEFAGTGVLMTNGCESLKQTVKHITNFSNDENGISKYFKEEKGYESSN